MLVAQTINEVITNLDSVINWCIQHNSRMGYFACLYRKMTIAVKDGIKNGSFENAGRMESLDVVFANRYLQAWEKYIQHKPCSNAWCKAFDAANNDSLIVLQHLFLGMNTHINLDLCIAAAQISMGTSIYSLEKDFNTINDVINSTMQQVQHDMTEVWPPLQLLLNLADNKHQAILNFSISSARKASWANAVALATMTLDKSSGYINAIDNTVVKIADKIINPGFMAGLLLIPIKKMEQNSIAKNLQCLKD